MALRGAKSTTAASAVLVSGHTASEPVMLDAPAFNPGQPGASTLSEAASSDSTAFESRFPLPFEESDSVLFDAYPDEEPDERTHSVQFDSRAGLENDLDRGDTTDFEGFVAFTGNTDYEHTDVDNSAPIDQSAAPEATAESLFERAGVVEAQAEDPAWEEAAADPWEQPLAAWDYSRSEWPGLHNRSSWQQSFHKLRWAIAAGVVIAFAGGMYLLVGGPIDPEGVTGNGAKAQVSAVTPLPVPSGPGDAGGLAVAVPAQSDKAAAETPKQAELSDQEAVVGKADGAIGQFSLQAAAFATQSGADEFAEKLKQAGLASYVVPADIARRGRWYRVRVGKFDSAENAQKFAAEAQRRARAAGIGVELIVCQYGQP